MKALLAVIAVVVIIALFVSWQVRSEADTIGDVGGSSSGPESDDHRQVN